MPYAVNVADMTTLQGRDAIIKFTITKHMDRSGVVNAEPKRVDGSAVVLTCPDEQAQAIIEMTRVHINRNKLRFYHRNGDKGQWRRV